MLKIWERRRESVCKKDWLGVCVFDTLCFAVPVL